MSCTVVEVQCELLVYPIHQRRSKYYTTPLMQFDGLERVAAGASWLLGKNFCIVNESLAKMPNSFN